jgi:O-methyltransferase domain/Dimerisation domain
MTATVPRLATPAEILRLGNAFCDAKALLTAVELGLFTVLDEGPATLEEIRTRLQLHGRGLWDLLNLLVALGLLERDGERFRNALGAQRYLVRGRDSYIGGFLERSNRNLYPAYGRLAEALRTGEPQTGSSFDEVVENPRILRQFVHMMDALTHTLGPELVDAYDWSGAASVLDVGGCRGNLCSQIVKAQPQLHGHVFDVPQMEPFFDEKMAELGLTGRLTFHGGSFFEIDALPRADVVVLGHVLHDWDPQQRRHLVELGWAAVNPGGSLLVYDRMLEDHPVHVENLVISLDMLLVTDGGSEYTVSEMFGHAEAVGCRDVTAEPLGHDDTLVVLRKPHAGNRVR